MALERLGALLFYPLAEKALNRDIRTKLKILVSDWALPHAQRKLRLENQIYNVLKHAGTHVPYYRDLFREISFDPESLKKDFRYFSELPHLTKDIIHEQKSRLIDERLPKGSLFTRKTGGSTGISTSIYYDQAALDWTAAANLFAHQFTGRHRTDRELHILSEPLRAKPGKDTLTAQLKCLALNRANLYAGFLDEKSLKGLFEEIKKQSPYLIQGSPSILYAIAKNLEKDPKVHLGAFQVFESTGEQLDPKKIKTIESVLGCKIYNRYGTAEFGVTAHSKENPNELFILDYMVFHETFDLGNGLQEIVGTNTTNLAMPLVRYRTGDIGKIVDTGEHSKLVQLHGRVHDLILIKGNTYSTQYFHDLFEKVGNIDEFQFILKKNGSLELLVVFQDREKSDQTIKKILPHLPESTAVRSVDFDHLVRVGWRDKFKYLIRES